MVPQMRPIICVAPPLIALLVLSWITNILLVYQIFKGQFQKNGNFSQFFISTIQGEDKQMQKQIQEPDINKQDRLFLYSYELGVQHYSFFGKILEQNKVPQGLRHGRNLTVHSNITADLENIFMVHLFLKSKIEGKKLRIRGFIVGEEYPESHHYPSGILEVPKILQSAWQDIWMLDVNTRKIQYQIKDKNKFKYSAKCRTCPLCVTAELPKAQKDSVFELHMSTFRRYHYFSHNASETKSKYSIPKAGRQQLIFVLAGPFYEKFYKGVEPSFLVRVLAHHIHYHITYMAIDRYVIYCREHFLKDFLEDVDIQRYARQDRVTVVLWQEIPNHFNRKYALQPTMTSHAILAHWGANVRLLIADVDEFAGTPVPQANLRTLIGMCKIKPLSYVYRRVYLCSKCANRPRSYEKYLWSGNIELTRPLTYYNFKKMVRDNNNAKAFIDPNKVCTWSVHVGVPVQAEQPFHDIDANCLHLVHLKHMFRDRRQVKSNLTGYKESSQWLQVFNE